MTDDEIGELARMLQRHTALGDLCTDMQVRGALELALMRGWKITPPTNEAAPWPATRILST
jgi:hypothetical protein